MSERPKRVALACGLFGGAGLGSAWLLPGTVAGALLEWLAIVLIVLCVRRSQGQLLPLYLAGILVHAIGMPWFPVVIAELSLTSELGVVPLLLSYILFGALQFLLFALFFRALPAFCEHVGCRCALAWIASELLWDGMKVFPWRIGHPQIALLPFVQLAEIGGVTAISFLMFWLCESLVRGAAERSARRAILAPALALAAACLFGTVRIDQLREHGPRELAVALIQSHEHAASQLERYRELTMKLDQPVELVIWPQGAVPFEVHESISDRRNDPRLAVMDFSASLLVAADTYRPPVKRFRSALFVRKDGSIPVPYHKQALMPFGEYVPYASVLTRLKLLPSSATGRWTPGERALAFEVPMRDGGRAARVAPLVCYEDVIPDAVRAEVAAGAEILVDLASGVWARDGGLPLEQHHQIAAFRSIESRRALLRSSGAGVTAVIAPTGETLERLPLHAEGAIVTSMPLSDARSVYAVTGDLPWWILSILCGTVVAGRSAIRAVARDGRHGARQEGEEELVLVVRPKSSFTYAKLGGKDY